MLDFDYNISTKVLFGKGRITDLAEEIKKQGKRILLVYGTSSIKDNGLYEAVTKILADNSLFYSELSGIRPNPRITTVVRGIEICRRDDLDFILAVGGGSVIDCAKAIAAGFFYSGDPWDLFSKRIEIKQALSLATILTLAASGSEMNGYAVISNLETSEKLANGSDILRPKFSILDPIYTFSLSPKQTAAGVVDIYVHALEQYFSLTPEAFIQDRLAEAIFKTCQHYGPKALTNPKNYSARANLMWASSLALSGLISYGKVDDWATHAIEHAVSAVYDVTHGIGLAILAPVWLEYVLDNQTVDKLFEYGINVWGLTGSDKFKVAKQAIAKTREFFNSLDMPKALHEVGVQEGQLPTLAAKATVFGPIGQFKQLTKSDVLAILERAF